MDYININKVVEDFVAQTEKIRILGKKRERGGGGTDTKIQINLV